MQRCWIGLAGRLLGILVLSRSASAFETVIYPGTNGKTMIAIVDHGAGNLPRPAVIALHGCGGLGSKTEVLGPRHDDWRQRLVDQGYLVIFPDSFGSRGLGGQCRTTNRPVRASVERADDVRATLTYLARRPDVQADKIALLGWSNGGSTVLSAIGRVIAVKGAVAFYPGCQFYADSPRWQPSVPLAIEMGAADNWTDPEPCETLASRWPAQIRLTLYPGAYHDFDWPNMPLTLRTGLAASKDKTGRAYAGTDPVARDTAIAATLAQFRRWFGRE